MAKVANKYVLSLVMWAFIVFVPAHISFAMSYTPQPNYQLYWCSGYYSYSACPTMYYTSSNYYYPTYHSYYDTYSYYNPYQYYYQPTYYGYNYSSNYNYNYNGNYNYNYNGWY